MVTQAVVAADSPAALLARPFLTLVSQERGHAFAFYKFQIIKHAHVVVFAVPFVQMLEPGAWHGVAFITVFPAVTESLGAFLYHAVDAARRLVLVFIQTPRAFIFFAQVRRADGAVHAARGDKVFGNRHVMVE
jgi:hypothetical protein